MKENVPAARASAVWHYRLDASDRDHIAELLGEMTRETVGQPEDELLSVVAIHAHELPRPLRAFLSDVRLHEHPGCLITGWPTDPDRLPPTPPRWGERSGGPLPEELLLLMYSSLLGDPFGWRTQQAGAIVHDVLPIQDDEWRQISSASRAPIWWHTEDAFHPMRADYIGLLCLRNPEAITTTLASVDHLDLPLDQLQQLFQSAYPIRSDESHVANGTDGEVATETFELLDTSVPIAVLFGDRAAPYVRLDPYFMEIDALDPEARGALDALSQQIEARIEHVALAPGDCLFVDNYRAVHGRSPFVARYDGTDRWLKRVNVTRDLRRSRSWRASADSRTIG